MRADLFGRKYVLRPVFYTTLLSRIVKFSSELIKVLEELHRLTEDRYSASTEQEYVSNVRKSLELIRKGFSLLSRISLDSFTLLHRDEKEIREELYEELLKDLRKDSEKLKREKAENAEMIEKLGERIKKLQKEEEEKSISREEKEELHSDIRKVQDLSEEIGIEEEELEEMTMLLREIQEGTLALLREIHEIARIEDVASKSTLRDVFVPSVALHEFSIKSDKRIAKLIKRKAIELRGLKNEVEDIVERMEENAGRLKSLNELTGSSFEKLAEREKKLFEEDEVLYNKLLQDTEHIGNYDHILIHRILHGFLHSIHLHKPKNPEWYSRVSSDVKETHMEVQKILEKIREQAKKLVLQTKKFAA